MSLEFGVINVLLEGNRGVVGSKREWEGEDGSDVVIENYRI